MIGGMELIEEFDTGPDEHVSTKYSDYFNQVLLREQPFYRAGMSAEEADEEMKYLNNNLKSFYNGDYQPLWKQSLIK
ncbi:MAG: hypothetical protein IJX12_07060 [Lachnospiraceae bacterium]|nr:hypothetical protein [Lachnospiraceae bacterium]